jgi:hypothetical protein
MTKIVIAEDKAVDLVMGGIPKRSSMGNRFTGQPSDHSEGLAQIQCP